MRKFVRLKRDGSVYNWNEIIGKDPEYETFEATAPLPEVIPDLTAFLNDRKAKERPKVTRVVKLEPDVPAMKAVDGL